MPHEITEHHMQQLATLFSGKPVIFGPNYHKFLEAVDMASIGAAFTVKNFNTLSKNIEQLLNNHESYQKSASAAKDYVVKNAGAVDVIINTLQGFLN